MSSDQRKTYYFGLAVSFALAGWIGFLGLVLVGKSSLGHGAIALVAGAVMIGGPLALLLLVTWFAYLKRDRGQVPGRIHALLFLPTLLALMVVPIGDAIDENRQAGFDEAHPWISETHVNLSGRDIWPDGSPYASTRSGGGVNRMPGNEPQRLQAFTRYPSPESIEQEDFPYDGTRLRDDVDSYAYISYPGEAVATLPLVKLPDTEREKAAKVFGGREASSIEHIYVHYPDRVEVAAAIRRMSGSQSLDMEARKTSDFMTFRIDNYTASAIARLEINGQMIDLGDYRAIEPIAPLPARCSSRLYSVGGAFVSAGESLRLRWQTIDQPGTWQSATATLPPFRNEQSRQADRGLMQTVLYILPDRSVVAERFLSTRSGENLTIRATGVPAEAIPYAACGGAIERYNPETVTLIIDEPLAPRHPPPKPLR